MLRPTKENQGKTKKNKEIRKNKGNQGAPVPRQLAPARGPPKSKEKTKGSKVVYARAQGSYGCLSVSGWGGCVGRPVFVL